MALVAIEKFTLREASLQRIPQPEIERLHTHCHPLVMTYSGRRGGGSDRLKNIIR